MFIWMLAIVLLVAYFVIAWASLGARLQGRTLGRVAGFALAALVVWRLGVSLLQLDPVLAFAAYLVILAGGIYPLLRRRPASTKRAGRAASKGRGKRHAGSR